MREHRYICHHAMAQVRVEALGMVGAPMVYELVNWLQQQMPEFVKRPPPLTKLKPHRPLALTMPHERHAATSANSEGGESSDQGGHGDGGDRAKGGRRGHKQQRQQQQHSRGGVDRMSDAPTLVQKHRRVFESPAYKRMREARAKLPAWSYQDRIVECIRDNQASNCPVLAVCCA